MLSNLGFRSSQLPQFCWCLVGGEPDKGDSEAEATLSKCYNPFVNQKVFLFQKNREVGCYVLGSFCVCGLM